jgi:bifunctional non-homologous end joining protein LigD
MKKDTLKKYHKKRNFHKTPEPFGKPIESNENPIFVIQKHKSRNLHYDFRIEVDGVLKSWAVPKGPSTDPKYKRLAIQTEDHPLDYAKFEGVIPEGEYGAGVVMVWDSGTYKNLKEDEEKFIPMEKAIEDGHVTIYLMGKKLKGGYALIRVGKDNRWMLIKMKDDKADTEKDYLESEPNSAISGRTLEQIEKTSRNEDKSR